MATPEHHTAAPTHNMFAELRRRNEYAAQVARMLDAKRQQQIDQAIQVQRRQRVHQAR